MITDEGNSEYYTDEDTTGIRKKKKIRKHTTGVLNFVIPNFEGFWDCSLTVLFVIGIFFKPLPSSLHFNCILVLYVLYALCNHKH